ncbi:MAG: RidA family protein [Gammaproteobacteria bacterium]|nr:RidA family protein [Gammaproteobacteria bacterium]
MSDRKQVRSGAPWEAVAGYSRAVLVGNQVYISGTAPVDENGRVVGRGDPYRQAQRCIEIISAALDEIGGGLEHVVRTRMFVLDIEQWPDIARAHQEAFGDIMPATSMIEVSRLIDPHMLVEIEADAILNSAPHPGDTGRD